MAPSSTVFARALALAVVLLGGCGRCGGAREGERDAGGGPAPADASPPPRDAAEEVAPPDAGDAGAADGGTSGEEVTGDAGASPCALAYGPAEQPFRGPAALVAAPTELRLVTNETGKPRVFSVPVAPPGARVAPPPRPSSFVGVRWPPCEIAGRWAYCEGPGGAIYRTTLGASDTKEVAKARGGTRIAAAPLGADHAVVAYVQVHRTTEGDMMQAFATLDDGEAVRLSEEGAGATSVRLVPRGDAAVAVYIDARTAMVPLHARPVRASNGALALGDDAVVFVGPPPERGVDFAVAGGRRALFALVPLPHETADFGMAAVRVADPPKDAVAAVWSLYPNGLDPAPLAATYRKDGDDDAWVARVRPRERAAWSPRVLELGRLDAKGAFTSLGVLAENKRISDVAITTDVHGAVWILYGDETVTWLERRVCP